MKRFQGGEINILMVKGLNDGIKEILFVYCKSKVHVVKFESVYEYLDICSPYFCFYEVYYPSSFRSC